MSNNKEKQEKCTIHSVMPRFSVGDKVKTIVGARDKFYHTKRKGSKGFIEKIGNVGGLCYYIKFNDHCEWFYEHELNKA